MSMYDVTSRGSLLHNNPKSLLRTVWKHAFVVVFSQLLQFGFNSNAVLFLKSYLSYQRQYVCYNSFISGGYCTISGNLRPLLFLLLKNDLCETIKDVFDNVILLKCSYITQHTNLCNIIN